MGKQISIVGLKRHKRLERKTPLKRTAWLRSKSPRNPVFSPSKSTKPRNGLRKVSKKLAQQQRKYYPISRDFLRQPENRYCQICLCRSLEGHLDQIKLICQKAEEDGDYIFQASGAVLRRATEVHHYAGRIGRLLCYTPYFVASCRGCRDWPHDNRREAANLGLVAPPQLWNVFPL